MDDPSWNFEGAAALFERSFLELLFEAQQVHHKWHRANEIQLSTLLSIKTGGCPEDCRYCSQSAFAKSGPKAEKLLDSSQAARVEEVVQ